MAQTQSKSQGSLCAIASKLAGEPGVAHGENGKKGFGSSALKVNGKIFAMVTPAGAFVVKLPKQRVAELEAQGTGGRFDPGHGRLMKEWLSLKTGSTQEWLALATEALAFVGKNDDRLPPAV